jgi:hypothetical protein
MKKPNNGKTNYKLFYLAASLFFIASAISAISGRSPASSLGLGALFLALGLIHSKKAKDNE